MALTINNFWGAETGGLEENSTTGGSPTVVAAAAHSGGYGYRLDPAGVADTIAFSAFGTVANAGDNLILGFWVRMGDVTPSSGDTVFCDAGSMELVMEATTGDLLIQGGSGTIRTVTVPFSVDTWYFIEVYWEPSATGTIEVFIDGVSQGEDTSQDLPTAPVNLLFRSVLEVGFDTDIDDIYLMSGATAATDRLGGCEVLAYRSSLASATGDAGGALDVGTWDLVQAVPFAATEQAAYDSTGAGSVDTNDVGGSAGTGGPNTDANITGTIDATKGISTMKRSGGGGTDHFILLGNSVDGTTRSADLAPTTSFVTYFMVSELASIVPTTSEYSRIGFEQTNAQDYECAGMLAQILHVPAVAAVAAFPYHIIKQRRRREMRTLVTL